ncbi:hypothetical protein BSL82_01185 [Tardibacter chloracetimidivorans]|uniref:Uncharacterized protein n=1 Tax=Tardibacter chloracetimidivorans TaxID=1921510 RepID=A0A1L3ZR27_9SPHN|nr:hypothetical protein [Tardibacter chloracetimidivorans]API58079.1 hypothetical protein BSL82_01185 [Tardibacter chloracetimidivorans]
MAEIVSLSVRLAPVAIGFDVVANGTTVRVFEIMDIDLIPASNRTIRLETGRRYEYSADGEDIEHLAIAALACVMDDLSAPRVNDNGVPLPKLLGPELTFEGDTLLLREVRDRLAARADELTTNIEPPQRYLDLVAAVQNEVEDKTCVVVRHGWPVLSVGDRTPTVAEAGAVTSSGGGSA